MEKNASSSSNNKIIQKERKHKLTSKNGRKRTTLQNKPKTSGNVIFYEKQDLQIRSFQFAPKKQEKTNYIFESSILKTEKFQNIEKLEIESSLNSKKINNLTIYINRYLKLIKELRNNLSDLYGNLSETLEMKNSHKIKRRRSLYKRKKSLKLSSIDATKLTQERFDKQVIIQKNVKSLFRKKKSCENLKKELKEIKQTIEFKQVELKQNYDGDIKKKFQDVRNLSEIKKSGLLKKLLFMKKLENDYFKLKNKPISFFILRVFDEEDVFNLDRKFVTGKNSLKINPSYVKNNISLKTSYKLSPHFSFHFDNNKKSKFIKKLNESTTIFFLNLYVESFNESKLNFEFETQKTIYNFPFSLTKNKIQLNILFVYDCREFILDILKILFSKISDIVLNCNTFKESSKPQLDQSDNVLMKIKSQSSLKEFDLEDILEEIEKNREMDLFLDFSFQTLVQEITERIPIRLVFINSENIANQVFEEDLNYQNLLFIEDNFYINKRNQDLIEIEVKKSQSKFNFLNNLIKSQK